MSECVPILTDDEHWEACGCKTDLTKTGHSSIGDTLLKVSLLQSQLEELDRLFAQLEGYVLNLSQTGWLNAIDLLVEFGHAELAGLVRHFMANAMNTFTGDD